MPVRKRPARPRRDRTTLLAVIPAKAGTQPKQKLGSRFRGNDDWSVCPESAWVRLRLLVEIAFQPLLDLAPRRRADLLRDRLAALEQQHRRDSAHAVAARNVGILVDVELGHGDLVAKLGGDFLERRSDHPARAAPFRPKIDE